MQIVHDIEETIRPRDEWCTQEELSFFGSMGFLWERVFARAHADSICTDDLVRPGEFTADNITGSPDLIRVSDWTLIETKCTWRSVRKFDSLERNFWAWLVQVKSYCHMIGTNTAEIHVFFVAGDWRPPVPCVKSVRLEFTDREIQENWSMCVEHAKRRGWL